MSHDQAVRDVATQEPFSGIQSPEAATGLVPALYDNSSSPAPAEKPILQPHAKGESEAFPLDRLYRAYIGRFTNGLSPAALLLAYVDWLSHLEAAPQKVESLMREAAQNITRLANEAVRLSTQKGTPWNCIQPKPQDHRFSTPEWQLPPFNLLAQAFLLNQEWWHLATTGIRGVSHANEAMVEFAARQVLDVFAPSNFALTNPEVLSRTFQTGGLNFWEGFKNWASDLSRLVKTGDVAEEASEVGKTVAISPGKVVFKNELIELIQYAPTTGTVHPEPILIVPAWIMKYYILDLAPEESLVKFLVDAGFTVFMISWKNPDAEDRDLSLEDYRIEGVRVALQQVRSIVPGQPIHAVGYCLGGTLLTIAAATMGRDGEDWLKSITLLASQADFTDAGELTLFINESQVSFLEDMMWQRGFLDSRQMAGTFQVLRSNDLIWSKVTRDYLMGERAPVGDLMSWSADATRMPYQMHSDYLRKLFLNDDFAEGRYMADGHPVAVSDIRTPIFAVGTTYDHIAPWKSTYKINFLSDADVTYVLTTGGHNVGIVSPPGHTTHHYQVLSKKADGPYVGPDEWLKIAVHHEGSWWIELAAWLKERSGIPTSPPKMGGEGTDPSRLMDAPGEYVLKH